MKSISCIAGLAILILVVHLSIQLEICPDAKELDPCVCSGPEPGISDSVFITCAGQNISQDSINRAFVVLRSLQPNNSTEKLTLFRFQLGIPLFGETQMTTFDLSPLLNSRINNVVIAGNPYLSSIIGLPLDFLNGTTIETKSLRFVDNPSLTDSGFGNTLFYFSMETLTELNLALNQFQGSSDGTEFLPGLSRLTQIRKLNVRNNFINKILGGHFTTLSNLNFLDLSFNDIEEIGEGAFAFSPPLRTNIHIDLQFNKLTESGIHVNCGIGELNVERGKLELQDNLIDTLPFSKFEAYLRNRNEMQLGGNPIICDERVKWLKNEKEFFQTYLMNADCINDPKHTVFTSDKV